MLGKNELVYGPSTLEKIVACEYLSGDTLQLFLETPDGCDTITKKVPHWLIADRRMPGSVEIKGNLPLKYFKTFRNAKDIWDTKRDMPPTTQYLQVYDERERAMILGGFTYFKGLTPKDVGTLSFDIEATGITHDQTSKVLIISNTYQKGDKLIRRMFSYDEFESQGSMLEAWCKWVNDVDPSVIVGHNVFTYDFPYLDFVARREGVSLRLGRDGSALSFNKWESKFRRDATQFYHYHGANIFGRNIIDTFFLAIRFDTGRKYPSYGLKQIIAHEGLEVQGRQHYDASQIRKNYENPEEWAKIKAYAEHDADDSLALYNKMIPAFFYMNQIIPKTFQSQLQGASGAQINSMMVRAYVQNKHSLPLPSPSERFQGAISIGNPGVYQNCFKVDVASLYPSIMLEYNVTNNEKDPNRSMLGILEVLRADRLADKAAGRTELSDAKKILINSMYGFLNTDGLPFNSPKDGALVTEHGRNILSKAIDYAASLECELVNADTDSIMISKGGEPWTEEQRSAFLDNLNKLYPEMIKWEDDGLYPSVVIFKAKNYAMITPKGLKIKGSALHATLKEPALKEMIKSIINLLLSNKKHEISYLYHKYVQEIIELKDIKRWAFKKTITDKILSPGRTNEQKVLDALDGAEYSQGDKLYFYYKDDDSLERVENWNHDHSIDRLLKKIHDTIKVFDSVYDITSCPNYSLKRNKNKIAGILNILDNSSFI